MSFLLAAEHHEVLGASRVKLVLDPGLHLTPVLYRLHLSRAARVFLAGGESVDELLEDFKLGDLLRMDIRQVAFQIFDGARDVALLTDEFLVQVYIDLND